jgi:aryl-alcohol dehydrogenase (NADP+)
VLTEEETRRLTDASQPRLGVYPYGPMAQEQRSRKIEGGR